MSFDSARPDEFALHQRSVAGPEANGPRLVAVGPEQPSFAYTIPMPARGVGSGYGAAFIAPRTSWGRSRTTARSPATSGPPGPARLYTFDTNSASIAKIKSGAIQWAVDQQPYLQGYEAVDSMWLYLTNGNVLGGGQALLTGPSFIDATNVGQVARYAARGTR